MKIQEQVKVKENEWEEKEPKAEAHKTQLAAEEPVLPPVYTSSQSPDHLQEVST